MFCLRHSALLLVLAGTLAWGQFTSPPTPRELFESGRLQELTTLNTSDADTELYRGLALARLDRPADAERTFELAASKFPEDKRFPIELAGLAFQAKDYSTAVRRLQKALVLDPYDEYANNLLASLYMLQGNLDAAVKYWNRIGKPRISSINIDRNLRTNPVLLDRAFTISPASQLLLNDLETTRARIHSLQVFSLPQFSLQPKPDGAFYLNFRALEKNGFGSSKMEAAIRLLRGLPYLTIYPEYFNIRGSATNFTSLLRWDSNKRRASLALSGPLKNRPSFHYRVGADVRDENWVLDPAIATAFPFHSRHYSLGASLDQVVSGTWSWGVGTALIHESAAQLSASNIFSDGYSLQYLAHLDRRLFSIPEKHLQMTARLGQSVGRNFDSDSSSVARLQAATELNWSPGDKAGQYEIVARLSGGHSWGTLPFSELFMLGLERDNDLLLRGHIGTRDGKKGSAPLAQDYLLSNLEFTRRIFSNGLVDLKFGPFLDIAKPFRTLQPGASSEWLHDPGVALKIRVLGSATVTLTYGRNTRDGRNAFYASALQ